MFPDNHYEIIDYQPALHESDLLVLESGEGDYLFPSNLKQSEIKLFKCSNKIIGYIEYIIILDEIEIYRILIAPHWRRQDLASQLLSNLFIHNSVLKKINLEVSAHNKPALALYNKLGFKEVGLRKKYYKDGSDAILMTKTCTH